MRQAGKHESARRSAARRRRYRENDLQPGVQPGESETPASSGSACGVPSKTEEEAQGAPEKKGGMVAKSKTKGKAMISIEATCARLEELKAQLLAVSIRLDTLKTEAPKHTQVPIVHMQMDANELVRKMLDFVAAHRAAMESNGCTTIVVEDGRTRRCGKAAVGRREETRWCAEHGKPEGER